MANIKEHRDKNGKLTAFYIRVHRGRSADGKQLKPYTATFEVSPTWTEKSARKKAEAFAATFEKECREGTTTDARITFEKYCEYVIDLKERNGAKYTTVKNYRDLTQRLYPEIGHIKLKDLRPDHLNTFYAKLGQDGAKKTGGKATPKMDIAAALKKKHITQASLVAKGVCSKSAAYAAVKGEPVGVKAATGIAKALGVKLEDAFTVSVGSGKLSPKTILEYHRLISTVLELAVKEGLIPINTARRATPPKQDRQKDVNYFQPEEIAAIFDALESESIKWRTIVHLMIVTGCRRGEILGLAWKNIDLDTGRLHICQAALYRAGRGIYLDTPKTKSGDRWVAVPPETVRLLRKYRAWQAEERLRLGAYYQDQGLLFTQDNGSPMFPDSVKVWLDRFTQRHDLPHINPHAFRHSMASALLFNGMDCVSVSKRLGHSRVSTTTDIYSHVMEAADRKSADMISSIFFNEKKVGTS